MQYIHAILSFMLRNLLELTYLQMNTYCSSSCPGRYYAKQTAIIGRANSDNWQCNQSYQVSSCYPYYTCKFDICSEGNYNQWTACNSSSFLYHTSIDE
jgi:hypothetical protein